MKRKKTYKSVTKVEFNLAVKGLNLAVKDLNSRMDKAVLDMKNYVDDRFDEFEKIVYTKADHEVFMIWMDEAMKELRDARDGRALTEEQMLRLDDRVANHETRICVLEKK